MSLGSHGHKPRSGASPTYSSWQRMMTRVSNPNSDKYKYYGGRGITVCCRWLAFENFLEDMGERPEGMTLDRRDSDGNYEPSNCRWLDHTGQVRNSGVTKLTENEVSVIKYLLAAGYTHTRIAKAYKVDRSNITCIARGKTWVDIQAWTAPGGKA